MEFPYDEILMCGYKSHAVPQKGRNGVAILSKHDIDVVLDHLPGDDEDEQARYIEADVQGVRIIGIYAPNGNPVGTEKYDYKLAWMKRLKNRLQQLRDDNVPFVIGGDFNIIPEDKDCHDPKVWKDDALFLPESLRHYRAICHLGLTDAFRVFNKDAEQYTFWDYQAGAWPRNLGIRIDHFLLSPKLADKLVGCSIDKDTRAWEKPSDHIPITVEISS